MEKNFLEQCIKNNLSTRQIAKLAHTSQTNIQYWLKKFDIKTEHNSFKKIGKKDYSEEKFCPKCGVTKSILEFYKRRGKIGGSGYCKICTNKQTLDRQRKLKQQCIEYKGGKCEICGYCKCNAALDFHHNDPTKKEFHLGKMKSYTFNVQIKNELDKCILVCSNCHREIHDQWAHGEKDITKAF